MSCSATGRKPFSLCVPHVPRSLRPSSFAARVWLLLAAGVLLGVPLGIVAFLRDGKAGLGAVALAAVLCVAPGLASLKFADLFRGPQAAMLAMTLSMLLRMAIALGACLAIYRLGGPLTQAGFVFYLLIYYLATLAVETALVVPESQAPSAKVSE